MVEARPRDEPPFRALRAALGSLVDVYEERADRVIAAKRLALETPAIGHGPGQARPVGELGHRGARRAAGTDDDRDPG